MTTFLPEVQLCPANHILTQNVCAPVQVFRVLVVLTICDKVEIVNFINQNKPDNILNFKIINLTLCGTRKRQIPSSTVELEVLVDKNNNLQTEDIRNSLQTLPDVNVLSVSLDLCSENSSSNTCSQKATCQQFSYGTTQSVICKCKEGYVDADLQSPGTV